LRSVYRQAAFITAPSMTTPAVTYFQSATSSVRASAIGFDLFEQQLQPIEFTTNLRLQVIWQQATIAGLKRIQPLPPVAAQRLVARYPL
jgi:hypothetical protein